MYWTDQIDGYCERVDFSLWSEPVNALTNIAFLVAAIVMWQRTSGVTAARVLCVILFAIGIGSALFHTTATLWGAVADTLPIAAFILIYYYLVHRNIVGLGFWTAVLATSAFVPYAMLIVPLLNQVPFLAISNAYWTVPILLLAYAIWMRHKYPDTARGFVVGAAILTLSITLRSIDEILCVHWPLGTHFAWHLLNAVMLGYMIHVYTAHVLAARWAQR